MAECSISGSIDSSAEVRSSLDDWLASRLATEDGRLPLEDMEEIKNSNNFFTNESGDVAIKFVNPDGTYEERDVPNYMKLTTQSALGTVDLNSVIAAGNYIQEQSSNVTAARNYPSWANVAGKLSVADMGGGKIIQVYTERTDAKTTSSRYYDGTAWQGWSVISAATLYYSGDDIDEDDTRITNADMYGDTDVDMFSLYYQIKRTGDKLALSFSFVVKFDAKSLPSDDGFYFDYNVLSRIQDHIPEITAISDIPTTPIECEIARDDTGGTKEAVPSFCHLANGADAGTWHIYIGNSGGFYDVDAAGDRQAMTAYALRFRIVNIEVVGTF